MDTTLFAAADPPMGSFCGLSGFERSLIENILFRPRLCLHEAYYFTSEPLLQHVARSKRKLSLFEHASAEGVILPALRAGEKKSLQKALERAKNIYEEYEEHEILIDNNSVRDKLFGSVDIGIERTDGGIEWPFENNTGESSGQVYLQNLRKYLQAELPPPRFCADTETNIQRRIYLWDLTFSWRHNLINEAEAHDGEREFRRQRLFQLLARELGGGVKLQTGNPHVDELLQLADQKNKRAEVAAFLEALIRLHAKSVASHIKCAESYPSYNPDTNFVLMPDRGPKDETRKMSPDVLRWEGMLPDLTILLESDPEDLFRIRDGIGKHYMHALSLWMHKEETTGDDEIKRRLNIYANELCDRFPGKKSNVRLICEKPIVPFVGDMSAALFENYMFGTYPFASAAGFFALWMGMGKVMYHFEIDGLVSRPSEQPIEISRIPLGR